MAYSYGHGDLLNNPNTYFYSKIDGPNFLEDWVKSRKLILENTKIYKNKKHKSEKTDLTKFNVFNKLHEIILVNKSNELPIELEYFLKQFEITKRIFNEYNTKMRPINRSEYFALDNYVLAAKLFELVYSKYNDIRFLNALLKIMDIIAAYIESIPSKMYPDILILVKLEKNHINNLSEKIGLFSS